MFDKFGNIKGVIPVKPGTGSVPGSQKFVQRGFVSSSHLGTFRGSPHYDPLPGKASERSED